MNNFGEVFKARREELGFTLDAIEEETKIRKYYINALEETNLSQLPAKVYSVGFVRRYARILGLNEEEMVNEFKKLAYDDEAEEEVTAAKNRRENVGMAFKNVVAGLVFLLLFVFIGKYLYDYIGSSIKEQAKNKTEQQQAAQNTNKPKPKPSTSGGTTTTPPETTTTPPPITGQQQVVVTRTGECWVSAVVDGQNVYRGFLAPNEVRTFQGKTSVHLRLGSAGGVKIRYNGKDIGSPGKVGQVMDIQFPPPAATPRIDNNGLTEPGTTP
ncbi:MAG: helix-turn-helix domain-containing protein [Candidatus Saccharibacteria bacterium]